MASMSRHWIHVPCSGQQGCCTVIAPPLWTVNPPCPCCAMLCCALQDMPGWGEDLNLRRYLRNVISYVLSRREKDYHLLGGSGFSPRVGATGASASMQLRHSITACLYFLPPHRVKQADLVMMSAVSQLVSPFCTQFAPSTLFSLASLDLLSGPEVTVLAVNQQLQS